MTTYKLADVIFDFCEFMENDLWNTWQWKLDPYRVNQKSHVKISRGHIDADSSGTLCYQECSGFFHKSVYLQRDQSMLWTVRRIKSDDLILSFHVNASWNQITLLEDCTNSAGHVAFEYLSNMIPGVLLRQSDLLTLHSALVENQGNAFAICADSGIGKTTHARIWRDTYHALIVNGDRSTLQITKDGAQAYSLPWSGTSGEQINRKVPMKAIVILERGSRNEAKRIYGMEAFQAVLPHIIYPNWEREMVGRCLDQIDLLLQFVPVIRLKCLPNQNAAFVLKQEMELL